MMKRYFKQTQPHANLRGAMETRYHSKNGASPKSQTSRGNFLHPFFAVLLIFIVLLTGCKEKEEILIPVEPKQYGCLMPENSSDPCIFSSVKDSILLIIYFDENTQLPQEVLIKQGENHMGIIFGNNGIPLPVAAYTSDGYYLFGNYRNDTVSVVCFDRQKHKTGKEDYRSESIAELTDKIKSLHLTYGSTKMVKSGNTDFNQEFRRQTIGTTLLAVEGVACLVEAMVGSPHAILTCTSAVLDHFKAIAEAFVPGYKNEYLDALFLSKDFLICSLIPNYLCALTTAINMHLYYEDWYRETEDQVDDSWLEEYINDYIKIVSKVDAKNVNTNSADIITNIYYDNACPYGYFINEVILTWRDIDSYTFPEMEIKIELGTNIGEINRDWNRTKITGLKPNTWYAALVKMDISSHKNHDKIIMARGNEVRFITYPQVYYWHIDSDIIQFDYISESKLFTVKTVGTVEIEEIKSLNEDICTVQNPVFAGTSGDTTIYTVSVFSNNNISPDERQTQIVVKAKIKDKVEEKVVSIIQKGHPAPFFDIEPEELIFNYKDDAQTFIIKTTDPLVLDEVKSLDENICTVESQVFVNTRGDTTIHTFNVFPKNNISPDERQTQIVVKAKIKDKVEEKVVSIIQKGHPVPWYRVELLSDNNIFVSVDNPMPPIKIAIIDIKTGQKFDAPDQYYGRAGWDAFSIWTKDNSQALTFSIDFNNSIGNYVGFSYSDCLYIETWFGHLTSGSGDKIKSKRKAPFKFSIYAQYYHPSDGREWTNLIGSPINVTGEVEFIEYEY
ncbi:MAG: hypothetical protein LBS43_07900 [Prevotellaceae bacterium]|jgi:hypothetical protein|nr:hypothetical protein [Prevotellaceae bacterium]